MSLVYKVRKNAGTKELLNYGAADSGTPCPDTYEYITPEEVRRLFFAANWTTADVSTPGVSFQPRNDNVGLLAFDSLNPTAAQVNAVLAYLGLSGGGVRSDITALTGGASNALDGIATVNFSKPYAVLFNYLNGGVYETRGYVLQAAGSLNPDGSRIIKPADFNVGTNNCFWVQTF